MTNEEAFVRFKELYDYAEIGVELEQLVDIEEFKKTTIAPSLDTGLAYDGSIMFHALTIWFYAKRITSNIYNTIATINTKSLVKIIVLHQLGKVGMFVPNPNEWEVKKGKVYTFAKSDACLKLGELSKLLCSNAGVKFTKEEYEAMSILDKTAEEYEKMSLYRTHLSTVFKMSSDMAFINARERYAEKKNNE